MKASLRRGAVVLAARRRLLSTWTPALPEPPAFHTDPAQYSGVELTFLGTSSQVCARRHPSSLALRLRAHHTTHTWLFDAGEGALAQLQRSHLRVSQLRNIFITHMHPDHVFGLPGVIMAALAARDPHGARAAGNNAPPQLPPLTIYGPPGIRMFLRASLGATLPSFREPGLLRIVELALPKDVLPNWRFSGVKPYWGANLRRLPFEDAASAIPFKTNPDTGAITYDILSPRGETDRVPDRDDAALLACEVPVPENGRVSAGAVVGEASREPSCPASVQAGIVTHSVPSLAYVITEDVSGFRFDKEKLLALGIPVDGRPGLQSLFQRLLLGETVEFDGRVITPQDVSKEQRRPRRVCIVGDTSDASGVAHLAQDVDVLVHEATLRAADTDIARKRGHSSSLSAATFAKGIGAKRVILNHTSVAYDAHDVRALEGEARRVLGSMRAYVAHDMSVFNVPAPEEDKNSYPFRTFLGHPRWDYPELLRNAANLHAMSNKTGNAEDLPTTQNKPGGPCEDQETLEKSLDESLVPSPPEEDCVGKPNAVDRHDDVLVEESSSAQEGVSAVLKLHTDSDPRASATVRRKAARSARRVLQGSSGLHQRSDGSKRLVLEEADFSAPLRMFRRLRRSFASV